MTHRVINDFVVTLNGAINSSTSSIVLTGDLTPLTANLPAYLSIDNEIIEVTNNQ